MSRPLVHPLVIVATGLALGGCLDRTVTAVDPVPTKEERTEFPVEKNRDLDILFVIDNSRSMLAEQESLAVNFVRIAEALESLQDGLPNVRIGVVSTDMGAGGHAGCTGDDGVLQAEPRVLGCQPPADPFIENFDGATNYAGTLSDAFSCIARLGGSGCGFEQPLEAMRAALDGSRTENLGFLREDALLAVIFITDEDDCSVFDANMFTRTPEPGQDLGPQSSFRCFEFGVTCDNDVNPRAPGVRTDCRPRNDSPYMPEVAEYVSFLEGLKKFPESQILVAGIIGKPTPIEVTTDAQNRPCLHYSCGDVEICGDAENQPAAVPPIRLKSFIDSFALRHVTTICDDDLSVAVQSIADWLRDGVGDGRCLQNPVADVDPVADGLQPDCVVTEVRHGNTPQQSERTLVACDNPSDPQASSKLPCYLLVEDEVECAAAAQHLSVQVHYPVNETVPPDTLIRAHCLGE